MQRVTVTKNCGVNTRVHGHVTWLMQPEAQTIARCFLAVGAGALVIFIWQAVLLNNQYLEIFLIQFEISNKFEISLNTDYLVKRLAI